MSCQLIKKNGKYRKMAFNLLNKKEDNLLINLQIRMLNVLKNFKKRILARFETNIYFNITYV
jgi:hypothetical protein